MNTPKQTSIQLLITGGTIDKQYQEITGQLVFLETHLPELLKEANSTLEIQSQVVMQKDSLEMTKEDRHKIYQACLNTQINAIVITHGTDTIVETANYLLNQVDIQTKTIILTGAMRPYKLGRSDASFNIGGALMAAQLSSQGVYIVMNGQIFNGAKVAKNYTLGLFTTQ